MKNGNKSKYTWSKNGKKAAFGMVGLSLMLQNLAFAAGDIFGQLKDMASAGGETPSVVPVPSLADAEMRLSLKRSVPKHLQDQALALCILAREVIARPEEAGARFSADPGAYLSARGIDKKALDFNSREVKAVLALGDPEVRDAAMKGDVGRYLNLLERKGILGFHGADADKAMAEKEYPDMGTRMAVTPVVAVAELVAVTMAVAAAASAVVAITYFWTEGVSGESGMNGVESKAMTLLWGPKATHEIMNQYVSGKAEEWADAISELPAVKAKKLSKSDIKKAIAHHLAEGLK